MRRNKRGNSITATEFLQQSRLAELQLKKKTAMLQQREVYMRQSSMRSLGEVKYPLRG